MKLELRKSTEHDFDSVFPLFEQLWPNKQLDKEALNLVFIRAVYSENDELFCALDNDKIIGFCSYAIVNNLWQEGKISYMYAMIVDEGYRGNGIGTKLMKCAIEDSKKKGLKRLELDSGFPREKAHKFYETLGFEKRAYLFSYVL
jgi:ribosomal protein S18 acetylase RimI-like enzyme